MLRTWPVLAALLVACGSDQTDSNLPGPHDSSIPSDDCGALIASVTPDDGATGVELDEAVVVVFSEAIEANSKHEVALRLAATGEVVPGEVTLAGNGLSATFTPDEPLLSRSEYQVTATVCKASDQTTFETVSLPTDAALLPGRTYALDLADLDWIQPTDTSMADSTQGFLLLHVSDVDTDAQTLDSIVTSGGLVGGVMVPDCANVSEDPGVDLSDNPEFTVGPISLVVNTDEGPLTIQGVTVDAAFTSDASRLVDLHVLGYLDPAQVNAGASCTLLAFTLGGTCAPCPSGAGDCLVLEMTAPRALLVPELDLAAVCSL